MKQHCTLTVPRAPSTSRYWSTKCKRKDGTEGRDIWRERDKGNREKDRSNWDLSLSRRWLECDAIQSGKSLKTFLGNLLSLSSGIFLAHFPYFKQKILGRTNRLLSLIRHGPHWKRRGQQFLYYCVRIRYRGNVSTEPLPSNDRGTFTERLPSNDRGGYTDTPRKHTQTATWSHKPTFNFSK
jgi:hypothetical protein